LKMVEVDGKNMNESISQKLKANQKITVKL